MKNEKAHQRDQLIYAFGVLMQPFEELASSAVLPSPSDYRIAIAKVRAGDNAWRVKYVKPFTTLAHDVMLHDEFNQISHVPERLWRSMQNFIHDPVLQRDQIHEQFIRELTKSKNYFFQFINRVPIEWVPVVFEANTPFTSYLRIKEVIALAKQRLDYFDRYLSADFFHVFLPLVERKVSIRLVTTKGIKPGIGDGYGVEGVLPISNLAKQEFADYQLIQVEPNDMHDRNLRVDDQVFTLGPGTARAGMALTNFGPADSSPKAHSEFDQLIANGQFRHTS